MSERDSERDIVSYMDFTLKEENSHSKGLTFRFYCSKSHMHGFDDEPPKSFNEVYKVYYSWVILEGIEDDDTKGTSGITPMFTMLYDECSVILGMEDIIRHYVNDIDDDVYDVYQEHSYMSIGQPGSIWEIQRQRRDYYDGEKWVNSHKYDVIRFSVWNNYNNKGYRFYLSLTQAAQFAEYIENVNKYMLDHSEPI